ncbi:hypothetical protein QBC40DRAFT_73542 [Triangularia verruculosa]|uniref:Uncharacterized protein n=1 Tax=Triangularia verruculosa TaxID=2587418 RepID=A0AAN6XH15_9PEZI|nr:hypothetical protein QBC40DRAFT_73542 [Triangularia verruculosa]
MKRSVTDRSWRLPLQLRRQAMHGRTYSDSSEASHCSRASSSSEDQFAFSPATEDPPSRSVTSNHTASLDQTADIDSEIQADVADPAVDTPHQASSSSKSRPIAIEIPSFRRHDTVTGVPVDASLPPAPLSGRGDIPGGYFPLHEDPQSRITIPHPFHNDADMARQYSWQRAAESSHRAASPLSMSMSTSVRNEADHFPLSGQPAATSMSAHTPAASYIPMGHHDGIVLPLGKYYPTNWERRHGKGPQQQRPSTVAKSASTTGHESQGQKLRREQGHARSGSEVKRRIQQYQRDMVAQATMAARSVVANSAALPVALGDGFFSTHQLGANLLKTKPKSPRLAPLGSPGPVTPMSLEGEDSGYLTLGRPLTGADAERQAAELEKAMRADEARRNNSHSSLGALSV